MRTLYIIASIQQGGFDTERVSIDSEELCNVGLTVREFLTQYGNLQSEWTLEDAWTGYDPVGEIVTSWE